MTGDPDLSIVIVNWNTRDLLSACLQSLASDSRSRGLKVEVLVVDNASGDGSADLLRERFPWVRLFANGTNAGFAEANNQAIRESSGRHVLLLNPDTEVQPGALDALAKFMDQHSEAGAAGARLLNPDGSLQPSCSRTPTLRRELWRLFHLDGLRRYSSYGMESWSTTEPREVEVAQGAALVVRRDALEQVGLLDEDYFIYTEEVDLCYRLRRGEWRIYWIPTAAVVHHGGQSTMQVAEPMFIRLYESKLIFFRKHRGPWAARLYKAILLLVAASRIAGSSLAALRHARSPRRFVAVAANYRNLIRALPGL